METERIDLVSVLHIIQKMFNINTSFKIAQQTEKKDLMPQLYTRFKFDMIVYSKNGNTKSSTK